jgi:peptidyl-prolyl cis-trans isomerase SurA
MFRWLPIVAVASCCCAMCAVIDRIAVVVDRHAIKLSDIDRDLRVTEFLNRQPLDLGPQARRKAAERLIDQFVIEKAISTNGFPGPSEKDADALMKDLRRDRFGGSDERLRRALSSYGLTEDQLLEQLLWQLQVLRFIDQRFRPGVQVTDEEVRKYYDQHRSELERANPEAGFDALAPKIRATLEGEQVNQNFFQWLDQARKRARIEFEEEAFQ